MKPTAALAGVVLLAVDSGAGPQIVGAGGVTGEGLVVTGLPPLIGATQIYVIPPHPFSAGEADPTDALLAQAVPARLVRGDPRTELALVQALAQAPLDVSALPAERPPWRFSRVYAADLSPAAPWRLAAGRLRHRSDDALRHDLKLSEESVGGPLLSRRGEMVGILSGEDGALSIAAASSLTLTPSVFPATSAEGTWERCLQHLALGEPAYLGCLSMKGLQRSHRVARPLGSEADFLRSNRLGVGQRLRGAPPVRDPALGWRARIDPAVDLRLPLGDPLMGTIEALKMGLWVEGVHQAGPSMVWLLIGGWSVERRRYRFAQLMVRRPGGWLIEEVPSPAAIRALPGGWPPPLYSQDAVVEWLAASR